MGTTSRRRLATGALGAGVAAAVSLVLPWVRIGGRSRSSIELIGSAGALDVIDGWVKAGVVLTWFAIPALVAGAMLGLAADRPRLVAWLLVPLGPMLAGLVGGAALFAGDVLVWGAYLTAAFSLGASVLGAFVLRGRHRTA